MEINEFFNLIYKRKRNIIMKTETLTQEEIKEKIIELNFYLLTAMTINDTMSIEEIKEEISELIDLYLGRYKN